MIKQGIGHDPKTNRSHLRALRVPAVCLAVLVGTLAASGGGSKVLVAESGASTVDVDDDGLVGHQEYILGTDDGSSDSDQDGFTDLEELARGSDPMRSNSLPGPNSFGTMVYAYSSKSILTFQVVVYVKDSDITDLKLDAGLVNKQGQSFTFGPAVLNSATYFSKPAKDNADLLMVMTLPIPEHFIIKMGQINLFARVRDTGSQGRTGSAGTLSVVSNAGVMMQVKASPNAVMEGDGVVYRPLTGPLDPAPAAAVTGQICWQNIAPVASVGNLLEYSVQNASCQDFDSFCSAASCGASFGNSVQLIDPGSLLGG